VLHPPKFEDRPFLKTVQDRYKALCLPHKHRSSVSGLASILRVWMRRTRVTSVMEASDGTDVELHTVGHANFALLNTAFSDMATAQGAAWEAIALCACVDTCCRGGLERKQLLVLQSDFERLSKQGPVPRRLAGHVECHQKGRSAAIC
jgi:hypothetical protein